MNQLTKILLLIGGFAIFMILVIKLAGFLPEQKPETMEYNNFVFQKMGDFWYTQWQNGPYLYNVPLRNNPEQVESVPIIGELQDKFNDRQNIYVTIDPTVEELKWVGLAKGELIWNLVGPLEKNVTDACTVNATECEGLPVVTCDTNKSVILLQEAPTTAVKAQGTCVILQGQEMELLKAVDRFLYQWYGIITTNR